jgi:hypothetical protein
LFLPQLSGGENGKLLDCVANGQTGKQKEDNCPSSMPCWLARLRKLIRRHCDVLLLRSVRMLLAKMFVKLSNVILLFGSVRMLLAKSFF